MRFITTSFVVSLVLTAAPLAVLGYIDEFTYLVSGPFADVLETDFGMVRGAEMKIEVDLNDPSNSTYFLFLVVDRNARLGWYEAVPLGELSAHDASDYCGRPSTFRMVSRVSSTFQMKVPDTDRYSAIMLQCYDVALSDPVRIKVSLEMTNPSPRGASVSYSSIEDLPMIPILQIEIGLYCVLGTGLILAMTGRPLAVKSIHMLFLGVLLLALIVAILESRGSIAVNDSGNRNDGLQDEISLFKAFQTTAFFICSLLLSLGYSVHRPRLPATETKFIIGVMSLFFALDVFKASCSWNNVDFCDNVDVFLFLLRGIIIISVVLGANYTVSRLRNGIHSMPWSPTLPIQYYWLQKYSSWRHLFILYVIFPTFFSIIETTMLSWKSQWIIDSFDDFLVLFVYMGYGILFAPFDSAEVLQGFDGSLRENIE